jgi:hypothetical protein
MSDAKSVENKLDGAVNGQPWPYRIVNLLAEYAGPGSLDEQPNSTPSMFDQITTLAKILTRRHNGKDAFDLLVEIHDAVVKPK